MKRFLTSALAAALIVPPLAPAIADSSSQQPSLQDTVVEPQEKVMASKMAPADPLTISVLKEEPARAGGLGQVKIPIMRRTDTGPQLRNLQARVNVPKGARLTELAGKGWRCDVRKTTATCTAKAFSRTANPAPLYATFRVRKSWRKPTIGIDAQARWRGGPTKSTKRQRWMVNASGRVPVSRPLTVKLASANGRTIALASNGAPTSRQFVLLADIGHVDRAQVSAKWTQLSGPKTKMLQPARVHNVQEQLGQTVQIPASLRRNATFTYRLRLEGNGQVLTRTIRVRTVVNRLATTSTGQRKQFATLAKASNQPQKTVGHSIRANNRLSLKSAKWQVRPGKSTTVRIASTRRVASVQWYIGDQRAGSGRSTVVRAPMIPQTSTLVAAVVTLRNGVVLQESGQVRAKARRPLVSDDPSQANIDTLCTIAKDAKKLMAGKQTIKLAGGVTLEAAAKNISTETGFFSGNTCVGKTALTITSATLNHPSATLTDVEVQMTAAEGLTINAASWKLPPALTVPGINAVTLKSGDTPATARLDNGAWTLIEGELAVAPIQVGSEQVYGLSWIPLAQGWQFADGATLVSFLNSSEDHPEIKDNTLQFSQKVTGPGDLSIQLAADTASSAWRRLSVTASNIGLGSTADGDTLMASGTGTLVLGDKGSSLELGISCVKDGNPVAECELFSGFVVKDFSLVLSREKLGLLAQAGVRYGDPQKTYEFGLVGSYSSVKDWSLAAKSTTAWDLVDGMALTDMQGNVSNTPVAGKPGTSQLLAELTGTLTGLQVSDSVKVLGLSPSITNRCPPDESTCTTGEIRFSIDAKVQATLPGGKQVPLTAGALLNLKTLEFGFDFGFQDVPIGPKELNVHAAQFVLSNAPKGTCTPHDAAPAVADPGLEVGFAAEATIFEATVTVGGTFDAMGYCLWGYPGEMEVGPAMQARAGVLSYTDYPNGADLKLPNEPTKVIGGNKIRVNGQFDLPEDIATTFAIPAGGLEYEGTYDFQQKGITFALKYTPASAVSLYKGDGSELTLTDVGFEVSYSKASQTGDLKLFADGNLFVAGGADVPDSNTPMGVSVGFEFDKEITAKLQAGLRTDSGPIANAFGQQGLTVRQLAVSLSFTLPAAAPALSFNADVTLPSRWVSNIGIRSGARIAMAFRLATEKPCLRIEIGEQEAANRTVVVDIANKGFLTAQYFKIVIAPLGCTVPVGGSDSEYIAPGTGFEFDGAIVGTPILVVINAGINNGLVLKGKITVPTIDLYAVKLQGSQPGVGVMLDLDIDSTASRYKVAFDGGIEFGLPDKGIGARVVVTGNLDTGNENFVAFSMSGQSSLKLGLVGIDVNPMRVALQIAKPGKSTSYNYADVKADLKVHALGVSMAAGGQLTYRDGHLEQLRVYVGMTLDIVVAAVKGTAEFNYCLGSLSDLGQSGSQCSPFAHANGATPAYRVGIYGSFRVLWWTKPYIWQVFDQRGTDGAPPPEPSLDPEYVPGSIPSLTPHTMSPLVLRNGGSDMRWPGLRTYLKATYANPVAGAPACPVARLGSKWTPTSSTPNPQPQNVNPNPSSDPCGLIVDVLIDPREGSGTTARTEVVCGPGSCTAKTGPYAGQVLALDGPGGAQVQQGRDALIAGLRTPPGVLPGGSSFAPPIEGDQYAPVVYSPNDEYRMMTFHDGYALLKTYTGDNPWSSKIMKPSAQAWKLGKDGKLQGLDSSGALLWSIGTSASLDTDKYSTFLFVQDGFQIVQEQPSGNPKPVWGVTSTGTCFPNGAQCDTYTK